MRHSATLGEAMRCAAKYLYVHNPAIAFTLHANKGDDQAGFVFDILSDHALQCAQMIEHGVGVTVRIVSMLSEGHSHPLEVRLPHRAVARGTTYRRYLDAPIVFDSEQAALAIATSDLDLPLSEHNQELHDLATSYLDLQFPKPQTSFVVHVRKAIEGHLGTGACSHRQVADALALHPRTLQRRLREEGTTFEDLKDEARRDLAERYLAHPDVPLTQVSALLDYSEQSALVRSCRRWFQTTPQALRASLLGGPAALSLA
jgi:AraC-like DNA-binding protein